MVADLAVPGTLGEVLAVQGLPERLDCLVHGAGVAQAGRIETPTHKPAYRQAGRQAGRSSTTETITPKPGTNPDPPDHRTHAMVCGSASDPNPPNQAQPWNVLQRCLAHPETRPTAHPQVVINKRD
ncbi:hypothetical protein [Streptomyces nigra]|uniref:hypothetical protein n=1 Tax=Streptomyces nigra TaxID=1827580 RepID=UPI003825B857